MDYYSDKQFMIKYVAFLILFIIIPPLFGQSYGFDAGASCSTKSSRRGRARILSAIPCDITTQSYCNQPGNLYPWNAVRRFVHENQGLMKRMYGDVRHISILRNEITNNDIGVDDVERTAARYSRSGWKRNKYLYQDHSRMKNNDILTEPYFRRAPTTGFRGASTTAGTSSTTTTTTSTTAKTTPKRKTKTTVKSSTAAPSSTMPVRTATTQKQKPASEFTVIDSTEGTTIKSKLQSNRRSTNTPTTMQMSNHSKPPTNFNKFTTTDTTEELPVSTGFKNVSNTVGQTVSNIKIIGAPNLSMNKTEAATISTTLRIIGFLKEDDEDETTTVASVEEDNTLAITIEDDELVANTTIESVNKTETVESLEDNDHKSETADSDADESGQIEEVVDANGNKVTDNKNGRPSGNINSGQLFQDVVQKDEPTFVVNSRGVNACPVKEEVVAPFWANNTRGEVLALLNLYPFEQYVHWEKCTHEHKQMYCRDGCRCEQQYRLHRLLAYDPNNECRGIFSDWFRFPSCCICKCYDIPFEYRVTSRSPRTMGDELNKNTIENEEKRHPLDIAEDEVHRAIYEHATSDWYRRSFDDDGVDVDDEMSIDDDENEDEEDNETNFY